MENSESIMHQLEQKRIDMLKMWKRILPTNELLFDRWEKAQLANAGAGSSIYDSALIFGDVKIGSKTWIGPFSVLDGSGGLTIGDYCCISSGVQIYSHDSVAWCISGGMESYAHAQTSIGNRCYVGSMSVIRAGVSIGDCSVVGANSFVTKSFPPNSIIAGTTAKQIGFVSFDQSGSPTLNYYKKNSVPEEFL